MHLHSIYFIILKYRHDEPCLALHKWEGDQKFSSAGLPPKMTALRSVSISAPTYSTLIFVTLAVLNLISCLWNTSSRPLGLISFSPKIWCLRLLTANFIFILLSLFSVSSQSWLLCQYTHYHLLSCLWPRIFRFSSIWQRFNCHSRCKYLCCRSPTQFHDAKFFWLSSFQSTAHLHTFSSCWNPW